MKILKGRDKGQGELLQKDTKMVSGDFEVKNTREQGKTRTRLFRF